MNKAVPKLTLLGKLKTKIVGAQYYEDTVKANEEVFFERSPHNEFDQNAIEAQNSNCRTVGHIPRRYSAFLAPLIDEGLIYLKGSALDEPDKQEVPVEVDVYLTPTGRRITKPPFADNAKQVVHNMVAAFFNECDKYSASTIAEVIEKFKAMSKGKCPAGNHPVVQAAAPENG